jgi:hypothetical protein
MKRRYEEPKEKTSASWPEKKIFKTLSIQDVKPSPFLIKRSFLQETQFEAKRYAQR